MLHEGIDREVTTEQQVTLPNDTLWHEETFDLYPSRPINVVLTVNTFVPGGYDPRQLGVRLDWIEWR